MMLISSVEWNLFFEIKQIHYLDLFFPARIMIATIIPITATTIKIPKPIPALKMPSIAAHELSIKEKSKRLTTDKRVIPFMRQMF